MVSPSETSADMLKPRADCSVCGWLLKGSGARYNGPLLSAVACVALRPALWKKRFFELGDGQLKYWASSDEHYAGETPRGTFALAELAAVITRCQELVMHFVSCQYAGVRARPRYSLRLRASSVSDAETWAAAVRVAATMHLRAPLPAGWDGAGPEQRSVIAALPPGPVVTALQELLDHSFLCRKNVDLSSAPFPLRFVLERAEGVQSVASWLKYTRALARVEDQQVEKIWPPVITVDVGKSLGDVNTAVNEHWLFHGTTADRFNALVDADFRLDLAISSGTFLTEASSKADEDTEETQDGLCRMLVCRAVLGRTLADETRTLTSAALGTHYDSLCAARDDTVDTSREFVIYDHTQIYTAYVLHYRRVHLASFLKELVTALREGATTAASRQLVRLAAQHAELHPNPTVRNKILTVLSDIPGASIPALAAVLSEEVVVDPSYKVIERDRSPAGARRHAAWVLGEVAKRVSLPLLQSGRSQTMVTPLKHDGAKQAIRTWSEAAHVAVPPLAAGLHDGEEDVCTSCAIALKSFGCLAAPAVPKLSKCLSDDREKIRIVCTQTLSQLGAFAESAVPSMIECLKDSSSNLRIATSYALANLREHAALAAPVLTELLNDEHPDVRVASAFALGRLGDHAAIGVPSLARLLLDVDSFVRSAAATAIGRLGAIAVDAGPALVNSLRDSNKDVRQNAAQALGLVGHVTPTTVSALSKCLEDSDTPLRRVAATSLSQLGAQAIHQL